MANPIIFSVLPNSGLDIEVNFRDDGGTFDHSTSRMDPTDIDTMRTYTIKNLNDLDGIGIQYSEISEIHTTGHMSPMDYVTLPAHQRQKAAIPQDAAFFAFLHPPPNMTDAIGDYRKVYEEMTRSKNGRRNLTRSPNDVTRSSMNIFRHSSHGRSGIWKNRRKIENESSGRIMKVPAALFAAFGGFIYFSDDLKVLGVNVYSPLIASQFVIRMAGPFDATENASKTIIDVERFQSSKLQIRHECSFVAVGWVRPRETFRGHPLTHRKNNNDGAFIFYKDNGVAAVYVIDDNDEDLSEFQYERGEFEFMADAGVSMAPDSDFNLFSRRMPEIDFDECRQRVNLALKDIQQDDDIDSINLENLSRLEESGNYPLLHQALKCKFDLTSVKKIVDKYGEVWNKDDFGWEALHYGCRYYADNVRMIRYILQNSSPGAVNRKDSVDRYPLHIACDSNPSAEVIKLLLSEENAGQGLVSMKTKNLHLLPLHIACNAAAGKDVIKLLLDADKKGQTIRARTRAGRMPLHIALLNRMSAEVIELLLDSDSTSRLSDSSCQTLVLTDESTIYQWDHGMLPLHMACLCGRDADTVKLLLDRDTRGRTLFQQVKKKPEASEMAARMETSPPEAMNGAPEHKPSEKQTTFKNKDFPLARFLSIDSQYLSGCRALHLSLLRKSTEISRLLLQSEKNISHIQKTSSSKRQERALMRHDISNRTCLHLACANNDPFDIIRLLLTLDPGRKSAKTADKDGCTPLHKACNNKTARVDVIRELLKTEIVEEKEEFNLAETVVSGLKVRKPTVSSNDFEKEVKEPSKSLDIFGLNPLSLAVKANAPPEVLELLLHPQYLDVNGFDDRAIRELARRIKNSTSLQSMLTLTMAQRTSFFILMMQLIVYSTALIVSLYGTNRRYLDERPSSDPWVVVVMSSCAILFVIREITQIFSEKLNYLFDMANIFELSNMVLFNISIYYFNKDGLLDKEDQRIQGVLIASTFLLIINIIFFLRSTILPFSRFAGGLINIAYTMIPFFLVSFLLLLGFTYSYRITYDGAEVMEESLEGRALIYSSFPSLKKPKGAADGSIASKCNESLSTCFMGVLSAFLSGGTESLNDFNDVFFGLIIVLVVLNVVIAIVSDAWDTAKDEATDLYWQGRLNFLLEMRSIIRLFESHKSPECLMKLDEIPSVMGKGSIADISWTRDFPYRLVANKAQYDNPKHFFPKEIADVINHAKSPANDLRWLALDDKEHRIAQVKVSIKWFGIYVMDFFLIIVGFLTFGLLWSEHKRVWLLSFANLPEEEDDIDETELEILREETEEKDRVIQQLVEEVAKLKNEIKDAAWD